MIDGRSKSFRRLIKEAADYQNYPKHWYRMRWLERKKVSQRPKAVGGSASLSDVEELGWDDDETLKAAHKATSSA